VNRIFKIAAKGFTLIELLVAIAVVGILVAIATPQFNAYRKLSIIAVIRSDLKNASTAEEAYYTDDLTYTASLASLVSYGFRQSDNVSISITSGGQTYTLTATHANCGTDTWTFVGSGSIIDPPTPCE